MTEVGVMCNCWVWDGVREPFKCDCIAGGGCRRKKIFVTTVVVRRGADIETGEAMGGKGAALAGCFVKEDFCARNGERGSVEIKITMDAGVG